MNGSKAAGGAMSGAAMGTAIMPGWGTAIGAVAGGLIGAFSGDDNSAESKALQQQALQQILSVSNIDPQVLMLSLDKYKKTGELTPELEQAVSQTDTAMGNISSDPRLKQAQMNALNSLQQQGQEGLTATDRAALNSVRRTNERDAQGRNAAILQGMAARGMGGSGAELAAQLANSQAATENASTQGDRTAAMAQQNALAAVSKSGDLAGSIQSQDFNQQAQIKSAQDAINKFNASNRQSVISRNAATNNRAGELNLANNQDIANKNTDLSNKQQIGNKQVLVDDYGRRRDQAISAANALNGQATNLIASNKESNQNFATTMQGGVGLANTVGGMINKTPATSTTAASPTGDTDLNPDGTKKIKLAHGGMVPHAGANPFLEMMKPKHTPIDNEANDTVPAMLTPEEIVVPKSIVHSSDDAILDFIRTVKKHNKGKK